MPADPTPNEHRTRRILKLVRKREAARVSRVLRGEFVAGLVMLAAAVVGFIAANSPLADGYFALRDAHFGIPGLELSVGHWTSDGLLAVFFFVVGLELKQEFVSGELSRPATAVVPVAAAFGGVAVPALIFVAVNAGTPGVHGWAVPTATDIAFAVAVLGLIAPRIPPALRMFLLTLAVVDDLIAIVIIALFYSGGIDWLPLVIAVPVVAAYAWVARRFRRPLLRSAWPAWAVLLPLGAVVWALFHASGIHATIAGVVLAFLVPARDGDPRDSLAAVLARRFQPLSAGFAVPLFACFAAGVALNGESRFPFDPIAIGVMAGLVLGKPIGISLTTWLLTRFTRAELDPAVKWRELIGVAALAGVGFTVALLVAELSYPDPADADTARLAVMAGSLVSVAVSAVFLVRRPRARR